MKRTLVLGLLFLGMCVCANAQTKYIASTMNAEELIRVCRPILDVTAEETLPYTQLNQAGFCMGYVQGISDGLAYSEATTQSKKTVCMPMHVTASQIARVVLRYGDEHPEKLHWPSTDFTIESLRNAFPCR